MAVIATIIAARMEEASRKRHPDTLDEPLLAAMLDDCLDALASGESDLDALAGRFPAVTGEIRPLLDIADMLREQGRETRAALV